MELKSLAKKALYEAGALKCFHKVRNKDWLTVLMFHRVLPLDHPDWRGANPAYTLTTDFFDRLLAHVQDYYTPVSLSQVRIAQDGAEPLPSQPLLVTFDDGWADNVTHALPILRRRQVPALFFVATEAIRSGRAFWQETLYAWACSPGTAEVMWTDMLSSVGEPSCGRTHEELCDLISRLERKGGEVNPVPNMEFTSETERPKMMTVDDLVGLSRDPLFDVGAHGTTHIPLTLASDAEQELVIARDSLREWLGLDHRDPLSLSFPHGQYNEGILRQAAEAGYDLVFDSLQHLTPARRLSSVSRLGRFEVRPIDGSFDTPRIAAEMAFRPRSQVAPAEQALP